MKHQHLFLVVHFFDRIITAACFGMLRNIILTDHVPSKVCLDAFAAAQDEELLAFPAGSVASDLSDLKVEQKPSPIGFSLG